MHQSRDGHVDRRRFLREGGMAMLAAGGLAVGKAHGRAEPPEDAPNTHNMLVVGQQAAFLSHLPMFDGVDEAKTEFLSPHRYQVILEAVFTGGEKDITELYGKDRGSHPETRIYTLGPEEFVLTRLFTPAREPRLSSFTATVFRGHLEHGGQGVSGLEGKTVRIKRVVHARKFDPRVKKPDSLEYIVFGKGAELFLAHAIFAPPDFDQVLSATIAGHEITAADLKNDMRLVVPDRKNVVGERLREGEKATAVLSGHGSRDPLKVQVSAPMQFYFEEGELQVPATFKPTTEERKGP
jgi:hypothetical protein